MNQRPTIPSSSSDEPLIIEPPSFINNVNAKAGPSSRHTRPPPSASASSSRARTISETGRHRTKALVKLDDQEEGGVDDDEPIFVGSSLGLGHLAEKYTFRGSPTLSSRKTSRSITPIPKTASSSTTKPKPKLNRKTSLGSSEGSSGDIVALDQPAVALQSTVNRKTGVDIDVDGGIDNVPIIDIEHVTGNNPGAGSSRKQAKARTGTGKSTGKGTGKVTSKAKGKTKAEATDDITDLTNDLSPPLPLPLKSELKNPTPALPLLPDLSLEPAPVPTWLGKTAVLLQLPACAVCKVRFKKTESGAARWRHMSTCRPPLYRPPNPPPDLQSLIHEALHALSAPTEPTSLLDLHVRLSDSDSLSFATRDRNESPIKGSGKKKSGIIGLRSYTNVRASSERGEKWDQEVRERIRDFIGPSSPIRKDSPSPEPGLQTPTRDIPDSQGGIAIKSDQGHSSTEDEEEDRQIGDEMPSTQPLGESSLAQIYGKTGYGTPSPSGSPSKSPVTPDSPISISISLSSTEEVPPPSSQKRTVSFRQDDSDDELDQEHSENGDTGNHDDGNSDSRSRPNSTEASLLDGAENQYSPTPRMTGCDDTSVRSDTRSAAIFGGLEMTRGIDARVVVEVLDSPSPEKDSTPSNRRENYFAPSSATPTVARAARMPQLDSDKAGSATPTAPAAPDTSRIVYSLPSSSPEKENKNTDNWGDEAMLIWSAVDVQYPGIQQNMIDGQRDQDEIWSIDSSDGVSSVPPSEAGLNEGDDDDDDDDGAGWGRDAYLIWDAEIDEDEHEGGIIVTSGDSEEEEVASVELNEEEEEDAEGNADGAGAEEEEEEEDEDEGEGPVATVESISQLVARGMPEYSQWDLKKLQKLVVSYGFRTSNDHKSLEKVATDCWKAIHPLSVSAVTQTITAAAKEFKSTKSPTRTKASIKKKNNNINAIEVDRSRDSSVSSADIPLAKTRVPGRKKAIDQVQGEALEVPMDEDDEDAGFDAEQDLINKKGTSKSRSKSKGKGESTDVDMGQVEPVDMDKRFYDMIMGDKELWSRILRYEPINFDEMISKSFAAGIDKLSRSWKKELKRYLDLQSITYFTEDPTGQRRRH
ncbi:hypothetical protein IAT40_004855 [Kwoniella sp. CBS 6097]